MLSPVRIRPCRREARAAVQGLCRGVLRRDLEKHLVVAAGDGRRNKAAVLVNLGNSLLDQHRWADAMECFTAPSKRKDDIGATARKNRAIAKANLKAAS